LAKHAGRTVKAQARKIRHRVDINTLEENAASRLEMNEIGLVDFQASQPLFFDSYANNRTTGSLILIDPLSNATVGAVMIRDDRNRDSVFAAETLEVTSEERAMRRGHRAAIVVSRGGRAQAELVERALWEQSLDAISVPARHAAAANELFSRFWELGLVFVVWDEFDESRIDREFLAGIAGDFYFELASREPLSSPDDFFDDALRIAKRVKHDSTAPGKGAF